MQPRTRLPNAQIIVLIASLWIAVSSVALADQDPYPRFERHALDSMLAPIALYPDHLLSQVLMAATYPQEVEEAAHWARERPGLSGDAAVRVAAEWDWDPSVRSLTAFPHVLETMAQHMQWTRDLGEAFLAQPEDVMQTVQELRFRAYENGTLTSTDNTRVIHNGTSLIIESVEPRIVYVPHYDARVVYGRWWWPAHPPLFWARWHGYHDMPGRYRAVHWGSGIGLTPGFFFGGFDWPRREVRVVNVHTYYYRPRNVVVERRVDVGRHVQGHPAPQQRPTPGVWAHDHSRRQVRATNQQGNVRPTQTAPVRSAQERREPAPSSSAVTNTTTPPAAAPSPRTQSAPAQEARERNARRARPSEGERPGVRSDPPSAAAGNRNAHTSAPAERAPATAPRMPVTTPAQQAQPRSQAVPAPRNDAAEGRENRQRPGAADGGERRARNRDRSGRD